MYHFGCGVSKTVGPKKQGFWPKINILKGFHQLIFFSFKNINLGDHFLLKTFLSNFNFLTSLFSKIMPNF